MSILTQLSSQVGDRTEVSNRKVVVQCLDDPDLLNEIAGGLSNKNAALAGDCAEVLTHVAAYHPDWIAPYAPALAALVNHKNTRVRWETVHALSMVAAYAPDVIEGLLPALAEKIRSDASVIVRDYAVDTVGRYASTGGAAAEQAYAILVTALTAWNGKQAGHALQGLAIAAALLPERTAQLKAIAAEYLQSGRPVVRKAAKDLLKAIESVFD